MTEIKLKEITIQMYDDIKEMPIIRYKEFQKYLLQDIGVGSDISDVDKHFKMLDRFMSAGKWKEAHQERMNLHLNLYHQLNDINIESICFACFIHAIDGKETPQSMQEDELTQLTHDLSSAGLTMEHVKTTLVDIKKKLMQI